MFSGLAEKPPQISSEPVVNLKKNRFGCLILHCLCHAMATTATRLRFDRRMGVARQQSRGRRIVAVTAASDSHIILLLVLSLAVIRHPCNVRDITYAIHSAAGNLK